MQMKFTQNEDIDKHIKRGLGPMDPVNMDDYWGRHVTFLEHVANVGSEDDIKIMFEENFGIDNLLQCGDDAQMILIRHGYAHKQLANSENEIIRAQVAKYSNRPEQFLEDDSNLVKIALIQRDIGLDRYMNDDNITIQREVVKRGYNLDHFVSHESPIIRSEVAKQGYGLNELRQDRDARVLEAVARQGCDLERFANYENERVQYAACVAGACPEKFARHADPKFRAAVARNGQCLHVLQYDKDRSVLHDVINQHYHLEHFVNHPDEFVRHSLAVTVYVSDDEELKNKIYPLMKNDMSAQVRNMIASDGYYLDQYVTDEDPYVQEAVARNGYGLDKLIHSDDPYVLMRVAEQGYGLEQLRDHPSTLVRCVVASQGYQPEIFVNDSSKEVSEIAKPILAEKEWEQTHEPILALDDLTISNDNHLEL